MITVIHKNNKVVKVLELNGDTVSVSQTCAIKVLLHLASKFPDEKLVWCNEAFADLINIDFINNTNNPLPVILAFNPYEKEYFGRKIGYVEPSLFINVNKEVTYPTWQLSTIIGCINAELLNQVAAQAESNSTFDYFLQSLAKKLMQKGVLCYSEPQLLKAKPEVFEPTIANDYELFRFVKQHFKARWIFLLLLNLAVYEKQFAVFPFLYSVFYKKRSKKFKVNSGIKPDKVSISSAGIDVIIPTIGRKKYLHDVLQDLAKQTVVPKKVIIVEQNPDEASDSELDYLKTESWPFEIKHFFTHQSGACNARNIALEEVRHDWVFLADDDIRMDSDFLEKCLENVNTCNQKAITLACLRANDKPYIHTVKQWESFGSGCSFVAASALSQLKFDTSFEFGFGEDADFGMQLRNRGTDVLYFPSPQLLHLKAPVGGFRTKPVLAWQNEPVLPKPSPTIMLFKLKYHTKEQIDGYKTVMFYKHYPHQKIKNPLKYISSVRKQWDVSMRWANELKSRKI